ncbi:DUF3289 family protein [Pantoea septica]|uniref:DUF3289 family protein n=1 Tax=Pantoea septica TaxID=472695 RepID=UPI0035E3CFA6
MDDYGAKDMRCGDLTEAQLKSHYRLDYISDRVDPWTLTRRSSMDRPQSMFCCNLRGQGEKIPDGSAQQCCLTSSARYPASFPFTGRTAT